ncbi:O-antigen ligase domain-containing protein [Pseudomonas syringae]|nr:O-antigen ligase domain-containing protein [Pseudomonas syringae]MCQ2999608.1 O-antigen ligase domain-containing protein [Pseudomonas syringae]MCQ3030265.1 O-antigen ligase domain-containing protein [Pseudomonas syringae]
MLSEQFGINPKVAAYFSGTLVLFLLSFIFWDSAKFTNNLFYALIALPGLVFLIINRGAGLFADRLGWLWLAFILCFLVPAVYAEDFQFYKHIAYVALFVFVLAGLVNVDFFNSGLFARSQFWVVLLYILLSGIYGWMTGKFQIGHRVDILPARMDNVIYASIWLFCALGLVLPVLQKQRRWVEAAAAVVLSLFIVSFVVQTRTALVGAAFLGGLWALHAMRHHQKQGLLAVIGLALLASLFMWLVKDEAWAKLLLERGDSHRTELLQIMLGEWANCGWLKGCGIDFHTTQTLTGGMPIQHPHNIFVAMGLYTGAVSLLLFVAVMALTLWYAWRMRSAWGVFLASALVMLNFDGSKLIGNPDELWVLVLFPAVMVYARIVRERRLKPL